MIELLESITLALIPGFLLLDFIIQRRRYDAVRHWRLRAGLVTAAVFLISGEVATFWGNLFEGTHLMDLGGLGLWGAALGVLVYEFFHYWYHRAAHTWTWLWRAGHQMHHSAEALDAFGAYYGHPLDTLFFTSWAVLAFYPLLGLTPEAGAIAAAFLAFNAAFQHANIRTPRWLGFLVQRPESHAVHHGRGIHHWNYSDLPLWDMLFGTLRNPQRGAEPREVGFYNGASTRIAEMLAFRDVSSARGRGRQLRAVDDSRFSAGCP